MWPHVIYIYKLIIITIITINYGVVVWDISQTTEAGFSALGPCGICTEKRCQQLMVLRDPVQSSEAKGARETEKKFCTLRTTEAVVRWTFQVKGLGP